MRMNAEAKAAGEKNGERAMLWVEWEKCPPCRRVLYSREVCGRDIGWAGLDVGEG